MSNVDYKVQLASDYLNHRIDFLRSTRELITEYNNSKFLMGKRISGIVNHYIINAYTNLNIKFLIYYIFRTIIFNYG